MMKARRTKRGTKYRVTETQGGVLFGNVTNARLVRVSKISCHSFASISNRYLSGSSRILLIAVRVHSTSLLCLLGQRGDSFPLGLGGWPAPRHANITSNPHPCIQEQTRVGGLFIAYSKYQYAYCTHGTSSSSCFAMLWPYPPVPSCPAGI